jgi:hypothetical protein
LSFILDLGGKPFCFPFATELQLRATQSHHGKRHGDAQPVEELGYIPDTRCEFQQR